MVVVSQAWLGQRARQARVGGAARAEASTAGLRGQARRRRRQSAAGSGNSGEKAADSAIRA
jgi:hypothetical protein